ncbi:S-adenosyl-L-methionine-dependent methyltransferase [Aspergillus cavernicola]|uniref:S-adenosyl-L-methionine-dependent methyltransferase n=1 Tax=Aspergillus cavernicola TaxID=176166 RepID=A0ABR4IJ53_9EURO
MSLYYDAVGVLTAPSSTGGSFKSRLYNSRTLKASPAQVYALITEAAKWDILLKEVIDQAGILKLEPKLTPLLSLLLVHDHLLAKNGIAATATHPLRQAVERHKARLRGEFTKARVRRSCATIPDLKEAVRREKLAALTAAGASVAAVYPRWVRINNVRSSLKAQMKLTFASFESVETLQDLVVAGDDKQERMRIDPHIPDLVAVAPGVDFSTSPAYKTGEIILQDKASCFPAYLLLGESWAGGDLMDGCAAPGNKTTHMASLLHQYKSDSGLGRKKNSPSRIYSMDSSAIRAKTLQKMVSTAGADNLVTVLPGQDFLALDPEDPRFSNVTGLLLDPSCSGSGIIGRDDIPTLTLPAGKTTPPPSKHSKNQSKKRKRNPGDSSTQPQPQPSTSETDEADLHPDDTTTITQDRLTKLSNLQTLIVQHALSFPAATHITYSTCSIHLLENECVVSRILASDVAKQRGWRVQRRDEQPKGLREWGYRGIRSEEEKVILSQDGVGRIGGTEEVGLSKEELEGCLRCWPGDEEGTGGFFVVGFVRDGDFDGYASGGENGNGGEEGDNDEEEEDEDEWGGFSD